MTTALDQLLGTPEGRESFCIEQTITNVTEMIWEHFEKSGLSQKEFAQKLHVSEGRISQLLHGKDNLTLKTIARALAAFDQVMQVMSVPVQSCAAGWVQWVDGVQPSRPGTILPRLSRCDSDLAATMTEWRNRPAASCGWSRMSPAGPEGIAA